MNVSATSGTSPVTSTFHTPTDTFVIRNIPASFAEGLADAEAGRTVDMDRALEEEPPL
jgi:hypothetical protein